MFEHTFISDWQRVAMPLALTTVVLIAALVFAFG